MGNGASKTGSTNRRSTRRGGGGATGGTLSAEVMPLGLNPISPIAFISAEAPFPLPASRLESLTESNPAGLPTQRADNGVVSLASPRDRNRLWSGRPCPRRPLDDPTRHSRHGQPPGTPRQESATKNRATKPLCLTGDSHARNE